MKKFTSRSSFNIVGFTAIGLIVISTGLLANHHGDKHQRGPIVIDQMVDRINTHSTEQFLLADLDKDGLISLAEFEQHKPKHGFTGKGHFKAAMGGEHKGDTQGRRPHHGKRMRGHGGPMLAGMFGLMSAGADRSDVRALVETEMFALLDANKDGAISDAEYKTANKRENKKLARKRAMFKTLDTNADGRLAQEEMPNSEKRLRALDTNNDGVVDRSEMSDMIKQFKQRKAAQRAS
jgi:Ca2+-binding EF-hand superfamily protein